MKPITFNNTLELTDKDIDQLVALFGHKCRQKTLTRLRSILKYSKSLLPKHGIFERIQLAKGGWQYIGGQSYPDEIRTVRELLLKRNV